MNNPQSQTNIGLTQNGARFAGFVAAGRCSVFLLFLGFALLFMGTIVLSTASSFDDFDKSAGRTRTNPQRTAGTVLLSFGGVFVACGGILIIMARQQLQKMRSENHPIAQGVTVLPPAPVVAGASYHGYPPQHTGDYPPQPTGSYPSQPTGGYQSQPYQPQPTGNYASQPTGGFQAKPTGNYAPQPTGDYQSQPTGDYQPQPPGNYAPQPTGGYQPQPTGNYAPQPTGGYQPQTTGNYPPEQDTHNQSQLQEQFPDKMVEMRPPPYSP